MTRSPVGAGSVPPSDGQRLRPSAVTNPSPQTAQLASLVTAVMRAAKHLVDERKEQDRGEFFGVREVTIWQEPRDVSGTPGEGGMTTLEAVLASELADAGIDVPLSSREWPLLVRAVYRRAKVAFAITPATREMLRRRMNGNAPPKKPSLHRDGSDRVREGLRKEGDWLEHVRDAAYSMGLTNAHSPRGFANSLRKLGIKL